MALGRIPGTPTSGPPSTSEMLLREALELELLTGDAYASGWWPGGPVALPQAAPDSFHQPRLRRVECVGQLIQIDGSEHPLV